MISHQQKGEIHNGAVKLKSPGKHSSSQKATVAGGVGADMITDPELEKFSGDHFRPEKYKEDGIRLANSKLPPFK